MADKHVPRHRAPKRGGFGRPNIAKNALGRFSEGDFKLLKKKEVVEAPPAHSSHVIRREAPPKIPSAPADSVVAPADVVSSPAASVEAKQERFEQVRAPTRSTEAEFDSAVAGNGEVPQAAMKAPPVRGESLTSPVSASSEDSARVAAREEQGSTLLDSLGQTRVKSAIRGGSQAWDPFLTDVEPQRRRFMRNGGKTDLEMLESSKAAKPKRQRSSRHLTNHEKQQHQSLGQWLKEIVILGVIAVLTAVVLTNYVVQAFFIPSESMENTLKIDDRVLVNKLVYRTRDPKPGDIVVFTSPEMATADLPKTGPVGKVLNEAAQGLGLRSSVQDLIKRVIAVEGQTVEVKIGSVFVDGVQIEEPYRKDFLPMPDFDPLKVPTGTVFVMGDNRSQSRDSRSFGPVETDSIVGRAFALLWPVHRFTWFSPKD